MLLSLYPSLVLTMRKSLVHFPSLDLGSVMNREHFMVREHVDVRLIDGDTVVRHVRNPADFSFNPGVGVNRYLSVLHPLPTTLKVLFLGSICDKGPRG